MTDMEGTKKQPIDELEIPEDKRLQAEETLQESERKFRELADLLPQTVFEIDSKGNLTFVNRHVFGSTGYSPEDCHP